jgi:spermidine synthase
MKPQATVDRATTPDGKELLLHERDGVFTIRVGGLELMSSRAHGSEERMAELVLDRLGREAADVLVGGLGMGFTLRAVLDLASRATTVTVAELLPAIVRWNREHLGHLAGAPLDDPRVSLVENDVGLVIRERPKSFDCILLDVDNGPAALTDRRNEALYGARGLADARRSLRPGGVLAVWSASPDQSFEKTLARVGFEVGTATALARRGAKGPKHTIFIAKRE